MARRVKLGAPGPMFAETSPLANQDTPLFSGVPMPVTDRPYMAAQAPQEAPQAPLWVGGLPWNEERAEATTAPAPAARPTEQQQRAALHRAIMADIQKRRSRPAPVQWCTILVTQHWTYYVHRFNRDGDIYRGTTGDYEPIAPRFECTAVSWPHLVRVLTGQCQRDDWQPTDSQWEVASAYGAQKES